jgi:hypothetical protein
MGDVRDWREGTLINWDNRHEMHNVEIGLGSKQVQVGYGVPFERLHFSILPLIGVMKVLTRTIMPK